MKKWIPLILIAITVAFTLSVYDQLPARVVTHWGPNGPNGWSSRDARRLVRTGHRDLPLAGAERSCPRIDPRRANYDKFQGSYDTLVIVTVAIACVVHFAVLGYALGWPVNINRLVPVLVGGLFLYFGWLLPRARSNFFVGIRTPWTLSSDEVWQKHAPPRRVPVPRSRAAGDVAGRRARQSGVICGDRRDRA